MRKTTIAEACTLHARIGWQGLTKKEYLDEGDYYLVTGVDFDNGHIAFDSCHYVTKDRYDQDQHIQLHLDDILVTKDGTIGKVAIIDEPIEKPATLNSGVFVVRPKDKATLLPKYLMYVLQSNHFNSFIERIKVGCTIAHLNQEKFYQFEFPLPPVDDQEKIIKVFDTMFSVLYARKLEIQKLDELIKARFVELFGDPITNPMKWKKEETNNHIDLLSGYPFKSEQYVEEGINICGGLIIMPQRIEWESCVHWPTVQGYEDYLLEDGDIVMALDRPWITEGFKVARVDGNHLPALLIQRTARIRALDINQDYLYYCFINGGFDKHSNVTGSLVPHISAKDIRSFEIMVPPIELQEEFSKFMKQVDKSKVAVQKSLEETQLLFDSLMQKYFG